ncbi:MAG: putative glycoside hydrolase [Gammaproteobacteria bacterium]|nr:putative glycoside hydrolase [Gammaproteobacteria bacterium]
MYKDFARLVSLLFLAAILLGFSSTIYATGLVKGIYLTQETAENTSYIKYLIHQCKAVGITTMVVDVEIPSKQLQNNVALIKSNHLNYVARVIVFPDGGKPEQIASQAYWEKRYKLVKAGIDYGATEIQLDYIRYSSKQKASPENAKNILKVAQWFKQKLKEEKIPLQLDIFGIASFGESKNIGQNVRLLAQAADVLCPMLYPSHFDPYLEHARTPYETILNALNAIREQFDYEIPVKIYAYIELSNYRYPLSGAKRTAYIQAQIKAVKDAHIDGWYAWSAHNKYEYLFHILEAENKMPQDPLHRILEAHAKVKNNENTAMPLAYFNSNNDPRMWPLTARYFVY